MLIISYQMLNRFSCIALAGVATEYLLYGYAEGGLADINQVHTVPLSFSSHDYLMHPTRDGNMQLLTITN